MWRKNKYGNVKTKVAGMSFHSNLEASVHSLLKMREMAGELEIIQCQKHVELTEAKVKSIPDFFCRDKATGEEFFVEAKGFETSDWRIKLRLWRVYGPGKLEIWKGTAARPFLHEVVIPSGGENERGRQSTASSEGKLPRHSKNRKKKEG